MSRERNRGRGAEEERTIMMEEEEWFFDREHRKELRLRQEVGWILRSMGFDPDVLGMYAALQEFVDQMRLRLGEIKIERKERAQDSLQSKKMFDATDSLERSNQEAERNKRMSSSHSSGLHQMVSPDPATLGATCQPQSSRPGAKRDKRRVSSNSGQLEIKKVKINPPAPVIPPVMPAAPEFSTVMPEELMNEITRLGGEDVTWVIRKTLQKTDLNRINGRLSIPDEDLAFLDILTSREMLQVENGTPKEVDVLVWVRGDNERPPEVMKTLEFAWCKYGDGSYILRTRWSQLVVDYLLKAGDEVLIWSFRQGEKKNKLCFAINVVRRRRKRRNI